MVSGESKIRTMRFSILIMLIYYPFQYIYLYSYMWWKTIANSFSNQMHKLKLFPCNLIYISVVPRLLKLTVEFRCRTCSTNEWNRCPWLMYAHVYVTWYISVRWLCTKFSGNWIYPNQNASSQNKYLEHKCIQHFHSIVFPYTIVLMLLQMTMKHFHDFGVVDIPSVDHLTCSRNMWRNIFFVDAFSPIEERVSSCSTNATFS